VCPIGDADQPQRLCAVDKGVDGKTVTVKETIKVMYVPMTSLHHQHLRAADWHAVVSRCEKNGVVSAAQAVISVGQLPLDCQCFLENNYFVDWVAVPEPGSAGEEAFSSQILIGQHLAFVSEACFRSVCVCVCVCVCVFCACVCIHIFTYVHTTPRPTCGFPENSIV